MNGAQVIVEILREQGVDTLFGYPGGMILPLYDALFDAKDINQILTTHEQNAAHGADGYARATGKVGVCIATSGPGATNLVTGLATAFMDSIPVVAFTGQVDTDLLGRDSFQEIDIMDVTMPRCWLRWCGRLFAWPNMADQVRCWWIFPRIFC